MTQLTWPGYLTEADVLYIQRIETTPLTKDTVSKKHIRILLALHSAKDEEIEGLTYITTRLLCELIADLTTKSYPLGDIRSFASELSLQGFLTIGEDEEYGMVYAITEYGIDFLSQAIGWNESYLAESRSPNCSGAMQIQ